MFGIKQTYRYMTAASKLDLAFGIILLALMLSALCYSVLEMEKLVSAFSQAEKKQGILYALYFATSFTLLFNPIDPARTGVASFDRVFGAGFNANVDVSRRVNNFYFYFLCFAVSFLLVFLLANFLKSKEIAGERKKMAAFLDQFMVLANVNLLLRCITFFSDSESADAVFHYSTALIRLVIILCVIYLLADMGSRASCRDFLKMEVIAYSLGFPVAIIAQGEWESGKLLFGVQMVLMILAALLVACLARGNDSSGRADWITPAAMAAATLPFLTSFYIELVNILNQHGVFIANLRKYYVVFLAACLVLLAGGILLLSRRSAFISKWKTWSFMAIVVGVTSLNCQVPLENTYGAHMFESANRSILISDFLNFGDIPIVQHYGGHMMTGVWEGILYAILNNDYEGAIFSPYAGYLSVMLAALFFLMARKVWSEEMAVFATLLFPFSGSWSVYGLGMLVCLAVWGYLKKNTWPRAFLIWAAFAWCALYRLDLGFSIGIACIVALSVYVAREKNWAAARQLGISLAVCGAAGLSAWSVICLAKGVNPVSRLLEFVVISLSNQNWSYPKIGNEGITIFAWSYVIIPFLVIACMCCVLFSRKFREKAGDEIWVALLIFGFAYFANFPRAVVRHSIEEMATTIVMWDAYLFLAIFISVLIGRRQAFLPAFAALILVNSALVSTATYKESAIADGAAARIEDFTGTWTPGRFAEEETLQDPDAPAMYWREIQKKGEPAERAAWDSALENTISKYRYVIDALLEPGETFVDMTNNTFLYSAINRRNPVYVSQSPLQLSGEYSQERFVEEIKGVPIVLMPVGGIYLSDAYHVYKVAEYVSQNYVPLCKCSSSYAVWCLPERYDEMHAKCKELEEQTLETGLWESFSASAGLRGHNCELRQGGNAEAVTLASAGIDPYLAEVQSVIDTSKYEGQILRISMDYASSREGQMQVFYTTEENESYAEKKSASFDLKKAGTATFDIPVTEFTRVRIDIPEESSVTIKSLKLGRPIEDIDFGYDEPKSAPNQEGDVLLTYPSNLHNYSIEHLPRIWADFDESTSNEECAECVRADDGTLTFDRGEILPGENGNYLLLRASYGGDDEGGDYLEDGETASAILKLGVCQDGRFVEKYQFRFTIEEGVHDYIFRVSCDYNWYHEPINSARLQSDADIDVESAKILEGD